MCCVNILLCAYKINKNLKNIVKRRHVRNEDHLKNHRIPVLEGILGLRKLTFRENKDLSKGRITYFLMTFFSTSCYQGCQLKVPTSISSISPLPVRRDPVWNLVVRIRWQLGEAELFRWGEAMTLRFFRTGLTSGLPSKYRRLTFTLLPEPRHCRLAIVWFWMNVALLASVCVSGGRARENNEAFSEYEQAQLTHFHLWPLLNSISALSPLSQYVFMTL